MEEDTAIQPNNSQGTKAEHLQPYQFKKGQSGNPSGRKAGKSLKEYAKEMLATMDEEERQLFLHGISKETIWKLAEGNPISELTGKDGKDLIPEPSPEAIALAQRLNDIDTRSRQQESIGSDGVNPISVDTETQHQE